MIVIVGICFAGTIWMIRVSDKNWSNPVLLICCFYFSLILASLCTLGKEYEWHGFGIAWLTLSCIVLFVGYMVSRQLYKKTFFLTKNTVKFELNSIYDGAWFFIGILIILGMFRWIYEVHLNGFSVQSFFSLNSLGEMNNYMAVARYSGQSTINSVTQLLNVALYSAPICGGFSLPFSKNKRGVLICICSLLPEILCLFTTNTKAGLLACVILFGSAYLCGYNCKYNQAPRINAKLVIIIFSIVVLLFIITFFSMMLRIGTISAKTAQIVTKKYLIYAFAEIQSFDLWFSEYTSNSSLSFGKQTYVGIINALGLTERIQGIYYTLPGASSNVYTVFRGIVEDFGNILGLAYIWGKGFLLGWCYLKVLYNPRICVIASMIFVGELFFFIFGYIVSPWSYLSYVFAMFVFGFFLCIAKCHNVRVVFGKKVLMK